MPGIPDFTLTFAMLGTPEIVIILFLILLLFGAKRLPDLARSIGLGVHEFKEGVQGESREKEKES